MKNILTFLLVVGFSAFFTAAQNYSPEKPAPPEFFTGVESAPGTREKTAAMCYGNTFVLTNDFEWDVIHSNDNEPGTLHLTVSLDYSTGANDPLNRFAVKGGTWSLVVMRENRYAGTLYGKITEGSVELPLTDPGQRQKFLRVRLQATGGMGIYKDLRRRRISGLLELTTDLDSRQAGGYLDLKL
ncbi:MAG TPA: hypothetical protein VK892_07255 [Pyrinomonadaceae bacterium]|nr:hypothetical protein [Pyrinomonadaceae bacterium]